MGQTLSTGHKKMNKDPQMETQNSISFGSLVPFLVITFIISWGILALYIFLSNPMTRLFGQLSSNHPLFFLAVWAPAISETLLFNPNNPHAMLFFSDLSLIDEDFKKKIICLYVISAEKI